MSTLSEGGGQAGGRRKQQKDETVRLIKEAALKTFREHGFESATTKQIAEAAGVAHGTVFSVAATKEALLVLALEEKLREIGLARVAELPRKKRTKTKLLHLFDGLFAFYAAEPVLSRVLVRGILLSTEASARTHYAVHVGGLQKILASTIDAGRESGDIGSGVDAAAAATNVFSLYLFCLVDFLNAAEPDTAALNTNFKRGLDVLFEGLATTAPER